MTKLEIRQQVWQAYKNGQIDARQGLLMLTKYAYQSKEFENSTIKELKTLVQEIETVPYWKAQIGLCAILGSKWCKKRVKSILF